jgi:hypothetical protein
MMKLEYLIAHNLEQLVDTMIQTLIGKTLY